MELRRLGKTNLMVTRLGFGGMTIPQVSQKEALEVVNRALDLGINLIDTARAYGDSEQKIGEVMKYRRRECYLSTRSPRYDYEGMRDAIDMSLRTLQTDYIDLYEIHDVSTENRLEESFSHSGALRALKEAKRDGKIGHIGVTSHSWELLPRLIRTEEFDVVMIVYNVVCRDAEQEVISLARDYDAGTVVMKVLGNGQLLRLAPKRGDPERRLTVEECLRFALSQVGLSAILVGCKSTQEVEQDFDIFQKYEPPSAEERRELGEFGDRLVKGFCWICSHCMPCPEGINIPRIVRLSDLPEWEWPAFGSEYRKVSHEIDGCTECGECEEKCPQGVPITQIFKKAREIAAKLPA